MKLVNIMFFNMENLALKTTILTLILLCITSCTKNNPFSGNDQLPAETQTGANTVGCLVNGKVFIPHAEGINPEVNCFYQLVDGEYFFTMAFADLRGVGRVDASIQTQRINLQSSHTYFLDKNPNINGDYTGGGGSYSTSLSNEFYTTAIKTGELKITKLDPSKSIISGTFWFDAVNSAGEKVEIRQGRFDWKY